MMRKARRIKILTTIFVSLTIVSLIWSAPALADVKDVWMTDFGGQSDDVFVSVLPTEDNGFVAVGHSKSGSGDLYGLNKGGNDALLVKYNENGTIAWKNTFGGANEDLFLSAQKAADDGFVAAGYSRSGGGDLSGLGGDGAIQALLVKYDADGNVLLKKLYRPYYGSAENCFDAALQSSDGGFIAAGYTAGEFKNALLVKYDETGNVTWAKSFGGSNDDHFLDIQQTSDNGYIVAGYSSSGDIDLNGLGIGGYDGLLVKYDEYGNVTWKKKFGGFSYDSFTAIQQTTDGGFIAAGYSQSSSVDLTGLNKGEYDAVLVKYDANGDKVWIKTFGGSFDDRYTSVQQTSDGGFIAGGSSHSNDKDMNGLAHGSYYTTDAILVKYDPSGTVVWKKVFGGMNSDYYHDVRETTSGFIAVGYYIPPGGNYYDSIAVRYAVTGSITINGLPGAVYQITQNGGIVNDSVCIGADGTVTVADIAYGTYSIAEKTPATGYVLNTTAQSASITHEGQVVSLTYLNEPIRGSIEVYGRPGGVYRIMQDDDIIVDNITIPVGGSVTENGLVYGTYSVVEVAPAEGYLPIHEGQNATITTDGQTISLTFANVQIMGSIKIIGNPGAVFRIKHGDTVARDNIVIPAEGMRVVTNVVYGNYTVAEIAPAQGQYLNGTPQQGIIETDGQLLTHNFTLKGSIAIYGAPGTILQVQQNDSVVVDNVTIPAAGSITKTLYLGSYSVLEKAPAQGHLPNRVPQNVTLTSPSQIITLIFTNELARYIVSFDSRGGSPIDSQSVVYKETANMPVDPTHPVDCTFAGWYKEAGCITAWNFFTDKVTADMTLYARWTVTVTFDSQGGSVVANEIANYNTTITAPASPTRIGYTFDGWFMQADCTTAWDFATDKATDDITLYAKWTAHTYTVYYEKNGGTGGSTAASSHVYDIARSLTPNSFSRTGYTFTGWATSPSGTVTYSNGQSVLNLTAIKGATITLYAKWTLNKYTIALSTNNTAYGSVSGDGSYNYGSSVTVKATPKTGYRFVRWLEGSTAVSTSASFSFTVTKARTLKAEFVPISYVISVAANNTGYGTVSGGGGYNYGSPATVKATPKTGYRFVRWLEAGSAVSTNSSYSFTVTKARTLKAEFAPISYAIAVSANSTSYGSVSGSGSYSYGSTVTVKATPKPSCLFVRWLEGNNTVSTNATYTFTVTKARTLKAEFTQIGTPAVKATATSYNSVKLTWSTAGGVGGYEVWRSTTASSGYKLVVTVSGTSNTNTNTGLTTGTTYYFKVRAYRMIGGAKVYGQYSAVVSARPLPSTPTGMKAIVVSYNSIKITWSPVSGAGGYEIWRSTSSASGYRLVATVAGTSNMSTGLATGTTYYYKVQAYRTVNGVRHYSAYTAAVSAKPILTAPNSLKATVMSYNSVKVTWSAVAGAGGYEVYRATSSGGAYTKLTTTAAISYTNTGLTTGKAYCYKVRAYRTVSGTKVYSGYSTVTCAKPLPAT